MVTQPQAVCPNCNQVVTKSQYLPKNLAIQCYPCGCIIDDSRMPSWVVNELHKISVTNTKCGLCNHDTKNHVVNSINVGCIKCSCFVDRLWYDAHIIGLKESTPVPVNPQFNKKVQQSYVRLKSAGEEINQTFFQDNMKVTFIGDTVRDAIAGGLVDNFNCKIWAPDNKYWRQLIFNDLARRFERVNHEYDEEYSFLGQWKFKSKFGDKTVCLYSNIPTPIWSCDMTEFETGNNQHSSLAQLEQVLNNKEINILNKQNVTAENHEKQLLYAAGLTAKYGWNIGQNSLNHINGIIEELKPLPEVTDSLIVGFRIFAVKYGKLQGYHYTAWDTEELTAICDQGKLKEHLRSTDYDRGEHGCGIYIYKDAAEAMNEYKSDAVALVMGWGNAFEGTRGWRVEHCRIDKLWIWNENNRPDRGQYNIAGGIILGAKQGDFFREIYSSGVDFENTHSRW